MMAIKPPVGSKVYATRNHTTAEPGRVLKGRSLTVEQSHGPLVARDDVTGEVHLYNEPAAADALALDPPAESWTTETLTTRRPR